MTTGARRRGVPILDGVETAVAAARVDVSSATLVEDQDSQVGGL